MTWPRRRRPVHDERDRMTPEVEDRIWTEVQRRIEMGPAGRPDIQPAPDHRPLIVSLAVVACALVVGLLVVQSRSEPETVDIATTVVQERITLAELGQVARRQPAAPLGEGQVLYRWFDLLRAPDQSPSDAVELRQVQWINPDGSGQVASSDPADPPDDPGAEIDDVQLLPIGGLTPAEVGALTPDPETILVALQGNDPTPPADIVATRAILDILATPLAPGPVRATLYDLLSDMGVRVLGTTSEQDEPGGVILVVSAPGGARLEAVVDPATATVVSITRTGPDTSRADPAITVYREVNIRPAP